MTTLFTHERLVWSRRRSALVLLTIVGSLSACKSPPTMVLFTVDTDLPRDRMLGMKVRVSHEGAQGARFVELQPLLMDGGASRVDVSDGSVGGMQLRFPSSFTVLPRADAPDNERVTVEIQVASSVGTFVTERRFTFVRRQPMSIPVYLSRGCTLAAVGCRATPCTAAVLCTESNRTCGPNGECIDPNVMPTILTDFQDVSVSFGLDNPQADRDQNDARSDLGVPDVSTLDMPTIDSPAIDVSTDLGCVANCAGRSCGSNGCGGTCGPGCSAIQQCDMGMGLCRDVRCSFATVDIYRHTGVNNVPHYTTSATPPAGEIAGGRIGGLWRDPGPRLVPMYYCNALNVIGWVSSEALCEGQPAVGVLLGYAGETLPLPECAVWGRRLSRCDNMEQLTITASLAVRNALIAMNAGGLQCRCPAPGCIYQEDGWENTRSFLP